MTVKGKTFSKRKNAKGCIEIFNKKLCISKERHTMTCLFICTYKMLNQVMSYMKIVYFHWLKRNR